MFAEEIMMHSFNVAEMRFARHRRRCLSRIISRYALPAMLALAVIPASHAVCSLDIDGNGKLEGATDGLLIVRYLLGIRGAALVSGALGAGATRTLPADIESYLATPCAQAGWVGQGTGHLNDTGISFGGEPLSGNNATCTSTGANIAQQDCGIGRDVNPALNDAADGAVGFSFTKISNAGAALAATATLGSAAGDLGCTYDNVTGLMWEVKTSSGRRSSAHTYSWFSTDASNNAGATGMSNGGICGDVGQCDTEKFVQLTNLTGLCGHNDWRMPHVKELESVVHFGVFNPAIDSTWFPNTPASLFWSGSPYAGIANYALSVAFNGGNTFFDSRSSSSRVRLVRAGQ
jgi:hypothetical protein